MTEIHVRTATLEYSEGQLFGRLVPLNVAARVLDVLPNGELDVYEEGFRAGAFAQQVGSAEPAMIRRVGFWHTHEHNEGAGYFGPASSLEERDDGVYGEFRILTSRRSDLRDLMSEGIVDLSIEFKERRDGTAIDDDDVRWRTSAHLHGVALDARGAYPGAEVLSFRSVPDLLAEFDAQTGERAEQDEEQRLLVEEAARLEAERAAAVEEAGQRAKAMTDLEEWVEAERKRNADLATRFASRLVTLER